MTDVSRGPTDRRRVPAWVGIALVVVCFIAGAAFIWWVVRDPLSGGSDFIPDPNGSTAMRPRVFRTPTNPENIRKTSDDNGGTYVAQAYGTVMNIEENNGNPKYTFRYLKKDLLPPEIKDVLLMKFRIMQDDAVAQHIGLTDSQHEKLAKISTNVTSIAPPDADREKLIAQWQAYFSAGSDSAKSDAEHTLLATLKQVGDDNVATTRQKAQDRADEIKAILTPDQIKKFQDMNNGP